MPLTELMVKQAKAQDKPYTMPDGNGLILEVRPSGTKYWIVRYWVQGKERRKSLGPYPAVTLKMARDQNIDFRRSLGKGSLPKNERFQDIALEWYEKRMKPTMTQGHLDTIRYRLERYVFPEIGGLSLGEISSGVVMSLCRKIETRGVVETTRRVKQIIGQVFRYAIATDRADTDPTVALRGALQTRKEKHHGTLTDPAQVANLIRGILAYPYPVVRCGLMFSALTFCRPGEIRHAEWNEIDLDRQEWRIPAEKMKMKRAHIVPLATQTLKLLEELRGLTGKGVWLFPSTRNDGRPMSENTIRMGLRTMGYANGEMTPHGFRAMASTLLNENGFPPDVIERQLAHVEGNAVRAAYNHAEYLPERRRMMQWWADYLDELVKK